MRDDHSESPFDDDRRSISRKKGRRKIAEDEGEELNPPKTRPRQEGHDFFDAMSRMDGEEKDRLWGSLHPTGKMELSSRYG